MHQPSSAEFHPYSLHPALRCALATLDTRLEDELARYRRYRAGMRLAPSSSNLPKAIEAAAVRPVVKKAGLDLPFIFTSPEEVQTPAIEPANDNRVAAEQEDFAPLAVWSGEKAQEEDFGLGAAEMPQDYLESSEELLRSLAEEESGEAIERNILDNLLTPLGVGSLLLMLMGSAMFGYLVMNPASLAAAGRWAQKVASIRLPSGAPTQQIAAGSTESVMTGDQGWNSNSPALDSQEFVDLSLNNFSAIRATPGGSMPILSQLKPKQQAAKNVAINPLKQLVKDKILPLVGVKGLNVGPIFPKAPNIGVANLPAPRGFDPPQVSLPQVSVAPRRQNYNNLPAARNYAPAPRYEAPAPRYEAPAPRYEAPAPRYEAPRYEAPRVLPPAPPPMLPPTPIEQPAASPSPQGDYRVVQPYTNDSELESAQKVNPEASFRNLDDGAYIQHGGSYSSKSEADAAAADLKSKGIEVEVK
ncbi:MAG: hypothetical protein HC860_07955 [Alkalinema sp. RU_4_3]|nr:hypothetical protein [Alkalinema sp. RU_4_3]